MEPTILAVIVVILLFSVIVHEVMHGIAARYFGDQTAERAGRLTLNPIPHIDPIGTILLPGILLISGAPVFGWAKPVPVNPLNFNDIRKGELWTSAAGVIANFAIALIATALFHLTLGLVPPLVSVALRFAVNINLVLAIFNLFPIPPLDGSKILATFLPTHLEIEYRKLEPYGFLILIALLMIPVGNSSILSSILSFILSYFKLFLQV